MVLLNVEVFYFLRPSNASQIPVNYSRILIYMVLILMLTVSQLLQEPLSPVHHMVSAPWGAQFCTILVEVQDFCFTFQTFA